MFDLVPVPLTGLPAGTRALAPPGPDGTLTRDRKRRTAVRRVALAADGTTPAAAVGPLPAAAFTWLSESDGTWLTSALWRRWGSVEARFEAQAWPRAIELTRAGVLTVDCGVTGLRLGPPTAIRLTAPWAQLCQQQSEDTATTVRRLREQALALGGQTENLDSGLAQTLTAARGHEAALPVLLAAASDLLSGVAHDGPRAFSQAHFGDTKTRQNAPELLLAAGASRTTLIALGLSRSPYLGFGGPIALPQPDGTAVQVRSWPGPVRFRVTPSLRPVLQPGTRTVALVENLQAAEAVCDTHGHDVAVVWFAGQPSDQALAVLASLAADTATVLLAPDADWGGVRIAARLLTVLPADAVVLDCGTANHQPRKPFGAASAAGLAGLTDHPDTRVAAFTAAVLTRGYPVEQEASVRAVLAGALP